MLFEEFDFEDKSIKQKFEFDTNFAPLTEWKHYYECYNYTFEKIIDKTLKMNYAVNRRAYPILFLLRHSLELCFKYNLSKHNIEIPLSHKFNDLIETFPNTIKIPNEIIDITKKIDFFNDKEDGSCYRYYKNKETNMPYFSASEQIELAEIIKIYNSTISSSFVLEKISNNFTYDSKIIKWDMTLHLGEPRGLGHIRTQYDQLIELIIEGIMNDDFDIHKIYLPLLFLIRHSLELGLKFNILEVQRISEKIKQDDISSKHSLSTLFNTYRGFLDKIASKLSDELRKELDNYKTTYCKLNEAIHILDINSRYFRFPFEKNGEKHSINLKKIKMIDILKLYYVTDPFITFTNNVLKDEGLLESGI